MKTIRFCTFILLSLTIFSDCNKCNTTYRLVTPPKVDSAIINYFDYKVGSWWIYSDSAGDKDSVYVKNYNYYHAPQYTTFQNECDLMIGYKGIISVDTLRLLLVSAKQGTCYIFASAMNSPINYFGINGYNMASGGVKDSNGILFSSDTSVGKYNTSTYFFCRFLTNFTAVNNVNYNKVVKVYANPGYHGIYALPWQDQPEYFARGVGIIQSTYNGRTYWLTKYNIVR